MKVGTLLSRSALVAASLAMFAGTARADGTIGQTLYKTGDMFVAFVGSDAAFSDDLNFFLTIGDFSTNQFLFNNHSATAGDEVDVNDATINVGDEAIFGICTEESGGNGPVDCANADNVFYSGGASANSDGVAHAKVWTRAEYLNEFGAGSLDAIPADYGYVIGFEDILNGGDHDYNDAIFALKGVTTVPEPVTMTLLATGLAGMGGAGLVRRRKKNV
jgi:hypothetical protein